MRMYYMVSVQPGGSGELRSVIKTEGQAGGA